MIDHSVLARSLSVQLWMDLVHLNHDNIIITYISKELQNQNTEKIIDEIMNKSDPKTLLCETSKISGHGSLTLKTMKPRSNVRVKSCLVKGNHLDIPCVGVYSFVRTFTGESSYHVMQHENWKCCLNSCQSTLYTRAFKYVPKVQTVITNLWFPNIRS